mgnify:CR=1 FL=1
MKLEKILDKLGSLEKNSFIKIIDNIISKNPKNGKEIEKIFNVEIDIYGFEGGEGLPPPKDFKDRLYQFSQGKWKQSQDKIKKNYILKKNSAFNLTKKSQIAKNRNSSEVITSKDLVSKHLNKWVRAWEKQDIELYLSFYSKEFKGSKERHADWRTSRQAAFKRPTNISIQLQNIQISQNKGTVEINFTQTFPTDMRNET